jgi:hypothetical protein
MINEGEVMLSKLKESSKEKQKMRFVLPLTLLLAVVGMALSGCKSAPTPEVDVSKAPKLPNGAYDVAFAPSEKKSAADRQTLDAKVFRENESVEDLLMRGGEAGKQLPDERFFVSDREKNAPVDNTIYAFTDDKPARCVKAKFSMVGGRKKLVIFSQSQVPTNYCVYQHKPNNEMEGFSLRSRFGGVCSPSYTQYSVDSQNRKLARIEFVDKIVPIRYCLTKTNSLGVRTAETSR